jgi:geranylgeranyl pyrophosphate synthase
MPKQTAQSVSVRTFEREIRRGRKLPLRTVFNLVEIPVGLPTDQPLTQDQEYPIDTDTCLRVHTFKGGKLIRQRSSTGFMINGNDNNQAVIKAYTGYAQDPLA